MPAPWTSSASATLDSGSVTLVEGSAFCISLPSGDMLGVYNRLLVSDDRLRAVTDHIHDWLFKGADVQSRESGDAQQADPSEQAE